MYSLISVINLRSEKFLVICKISKIIPVFKNSDNRSTENCRPIQILPSFPKLHRVHRVCNRLVTFLSTKMFYIPSISSAQACRPQERSLTSLKNH